MEKENTEKFIALKALSQWRVILEDGEFMVVYIKEFSCCLLCISSLTSLLWYVMKDSNVMTSEDIWELILGEFAASLHSLSYNYLSLFPLQKEKHRKEGVYHLQELFPLLQPSCHHLLKSSAHLCSEQHQLSSRKAQEPRSPPRLRVGIWRYFTALSNELLTVQLTLWFRLIIYCIFNQAYHLSRGEFLG